MSEEILNVTITAELIASGVPAQVFPLPATTAMTRSTRAKL